MADSDFPRLRRDVFKVESLLEPSDKKEYWLSKTAAERLEAVEMMRRMVYGYDPSTRIKKVLEITTRRR